MLDARNSLRVGGESPCLQACREDNSAGARQTLGGKSPSVMDCVAAKAKGLYSLAPYGKSVPTPDSEGTFSWRKSVIN